MKLKLGSGNEKQTWISLLILIVAFSSYIFINNPALLFFMVVFCLITGFSIKSAEFRVAIIVFIALFIPTTDFFPFLDFNKYITINLGVPLNMYTVTLGIVILVTLGEKIYKKNIFYVNKNIFHLELLFIFYIAVLIISLSKITNTTNGLKDILRFVSFTYLVFWVCINNIGKKDLVHKLFKTLVVFVAILSLYGIIEFALGKNIYFELFREWGSNNFTYDGGMRIFSTLGHPNILASIISCIIPLNLDLVMISNDNRSIRLFVVALYLNFIALILTFSRASWIACAISVFIYIFLQKDKKLFISKMAKYFAPTFVIMGVASLLTMFFNESIRYSLHYLMVTRLNIHNVLQSGSFTYRSGKILTAKKIISQHPITGVGYANYSAISDLPIYKHHLDTNVIKVLDNNYLTILVETGILGFISFFIMFINILRNSRKPIYLKNGITCSILSILISASSFELFRVTPISVILWVIIGLMFSEIAIDDSSKDKKTRIGYLKSYLTRIF